MSLKLQNLRKRIEEEELDAILISSPENRRYMSGFTGSAVGCYYPATMPRSPPTFAT